MRRVLGLLAASTALLLGCGWSGDTVDKVGNVSGGDGVAIPARNVTVLLDGCSPDAWQASELNGPALRRVGREVILLCAVPRAEGVVGPADPSARALLAKTADTLHAEGYAVKLGVSFRDETAERYDGAQTAQQLADATWRAKIIQDLGQLAAPADGVDLDLQQLPASASGDLTAFVQALSSALRGTKKVELMAPPSTRAPSDVPGGDAWNLGALAPLVDRVRVMTLDYAAPGAGPTIDPGWAVDAARFARSLAGATPIDIAMPLYGNDVSILGTRNVSFLEARALEDVYHVAPQFGPTGSPSITYTDEAGVAHELWYDDAPSTLRTLRAWDPATLPLDVGVVFYGLGDEDPDLWPTMARALP